MIFKRTVFIWLALSCVMLCGTAKALQSMESDFQDIQHSQFEDQFDTLLVDESTIPIAIQESNTAITRGVAVLLSEAGRNPFSQHGLKYLTESLNNVGWVTMVMPAPEYGFWPIEETVDQNTTETPQNETQQDEAVESEQTDVHARSAQSHIQQDSFDRHEESLIVQMQAVVQKTQQYPGFFLVIAQGTSAAWLTKIYAEKKLGDPDGLVIISPHWPDREFNRQIPQWTSQTQMPLLDIHSPWDTNWAKETVTQRRIQSVKELKLMYRQRELTGQKLDKQQFQRLGKEIYGWLTHMGW